MVDVVKKWCAFESCAKRSYFAFEGSTDPMYCNEHSTKAMADVCHQLCAYKGCPTHPSFNAKGEARGLYCKLHKGELWTLIINGALL